MEQTDATPAVETPTTEHADQLAAYSRPRGRFGTLLGLIGFGCLCTIILAPIGLILSLIGYLSRRHSGNPNHLVTAGLIGNGLLVTLASVVVLYLTFFSPELTDDLIQRLVNAPTSDQQSPVELEQSKTGKQAADEVAERATTYKTINGMYPLLLTDFERNEQTSLKNLTDITISTQPLTSETGYTTRSRKGKNVTVSHVTIYACGVTEGNKIGYWDSVNSEVAFAYSGQVGPNSTCAIMK